MVAPAGLAAGAPLTFQDNTKDVWTAVSSSIVFVDPFPGEVKENMLYSWEYGQRWATKQIHTKYGPTDPNAQNADTIFTHVQEWYGFFTSMLREGLHWIVKDLDFSNAQASGSTFTVDKMIIEVLTSFLATDSVALAAVTDAIALLKSMDSTDPRMVMWDSHSTSHGKGTFQMGAVRDSGGGLATMHTGALELDTTQTVTTVFFFFNYSSSDTQVTKAAQDLLFHNDAYTRVGTNGQSAKQIVESAVVDTSNQYLANDGGI